jgi:putative membrane protein
VIDWLIRIVINAAALIIAAAIIPDIHLKIGPLGAEWLKVAAVALVFALVNTYIKPIVKALSFPISIMTMGLVSFIINAALFLLVAWIAKDVLTIDFTIAKFPPTLNPDAVVAAILGSIIISIVSVALGLANFGRKVASLR